MIADGGAPIGGPDCLHHCGLAAPMVMLPAFTKRAAEQPLALARSLLACFHSWTSAGYLQTDFKAEQFTMDGAGAIYLVDGPRALASSALGRGIVRTWGRHAGKRLISTKVRACEGDADCAFKPPDNHNCRTADACEAGSRGAPETRGKCHEKACVPLSAKTHVWDVANRPWLLPCIAEKATGAERDLLLTLIRHTSAERPEDRPSFAQLVKHIDRS